MTAMLVLAGMELFLRYLAPPSIGNVYRMHRWLIMVMFAGGSLAISLGSGT